MDLLDRYLQAVKKHLPVQRQDDIIAELRANLESQLEDKESAVGRPLTTDEVEAWLKQMGPPIQVAARYQPQQYLIGPTIFPVYWFVLRTAFLWALVIYTIVTAVLIAVHTPSMDAVLGAVLRAPLFLINVAIWVTAVFAAIEFAVSHYPEKCGAITGSGFAVNWSPSSLPPIEKELVDGKKPRSYAEAVAEVVFLFLGLMWLLLVPQHPYLLLGPGAAYLQASPFQSSPIWMQFYWCVLALTLLQLVWNCVALLRGSWQSARPLRKLVIAALGLVPLLLLLDVRDHAWFVLKHPALDQARYGLALDAINRSVHLSIEVLVVVTILQLVWGIGRISLDAWRKHEAVKR